MWYSIAIFAVNEAGKALEFDSPMRGQLSESR